MSRQGFTVTIDDRALNRLIDKAIKTNPQETVKAVKECLWDLAGESAQRAPIESGDLRNNCTAKLNGATIFENQTPILAVLVPGLRAIGSVGYSLPYALRQHEDLNLRHDRTDGYKRKDGTTVNMVAGGEAKYLEGPFMERKARYIRRMEKIVKESLRK